MRLTLDFVQVKFPTLYAEMIQAEGYDKSLPLKDRIIHFLVEHKYCIVPMPEYSMQNKLVRYTLDIYRNGKKVKIIEKERGKKPEVLIEKHMLLIMRYYEDDNT